MSLRGFVAYKNHRVAYPGGFVKYDPLQALADVAYRYLHGSVQRRHWEIIRRVIILLITQSGVPCADFGYGCRQYPDIRRNYPLVTASPGQKPFAFTV